MDSGPQEAGCIQTSGLKEIPVQWASEKEVAGQMWKMTTKTDGKSIILKMGDGIKRVIGD